MIRKFKYLKIKNITNDSHFPHFFNIKIFSHNLKYQEIPILWKDGNIKSHLKPLSYVFIFLISVLKFFFTNEFVIEKKNKFYFTEYNF